MARIDEISKYKRTSFLNEKSEGYFLKVTNIIPVFVSISIDLIAPVRKSSPCLGTMAVLMIIPFAANRERARPPTYEFLIGYENKQLIAKA